MNPIDIATNNTADFIQNAAPKKSSILEIGCGEGDVALRLQQAGHDITAIDMDADRVRAACAKGIHATTAQWPEFQLKPVDAIIFTRSLHHIHPLDETITAAYERLTPGGMFLAEDFAFAKADSATAMWLVELLKNETVAPYLSHPPESFLTDLLQSDDAFSTWHDNHRYHLHTIEVMEAAVSKIFGNCTIAEAPYLYRFLIPVIPETQAAANMLSDVYQMEANAIAEKRIIAIGRRITATKKTRRPHS